MIKANELRIGDLVYAPKAIVLSEMPTAEANDLIIYKIVFLSDNSYHNQLYEPIPLTPEILEKCGFMTCTPIERLKVYKDYRLGNMVLSTVDMAVKYYEVEYNMLEIENRRLIANIQYLDQLQNLYFALTGEELNIKL